MAGSGSWIWLRVPWIGTSLDQALEATRRPHNSGKLPTDYPSLALTKNTRTASVWTLAGSCEYLWRERSRTYQLLSGHRIWLLILLEPDNYTRGTSEYLSARKEATIIPDGRTSKLHIVWAFGADYLRSTESKTTATYPWEFKGALSLTRKTRNLNNIRNFHPGVSFTARVSQKRWTDIFLSATELFFLSLLRERIYILKGCSFTTPFHNCKCTFFPLFFYPFCIFLYILYSTP